MIVGIDLGTTNSLVSHWDGQAPQLIKNSLGQYLTPSVIGLDDKGQLICGQAAKERLYTHPHLTTSVFKRYMGSDRDISLGKKTFKAQELSCFILKSLKADAEEALQQTITEAVITVPAYFNDTQRKYTKLAGELAGLKVERLINEPTAAALSYGIHEKGDAQVLVIDLGGGTFDVSILELFDGVMEVRASAGDTHLGGEDFSQCLIRHFIENVTPPLDESLIEQHNHRFIAAAERTKLALSDKSEATMMVDIDDHQSQLTISQSTFEQIASPIMTRLQTPIKQALRDSNVKPSELQAVLLVGGATRMPMIAKLVTKMFGRFPDRTLHPDHVVAHGAAIQAALKSRDSALEEVILTDVCPYTLGIEVVNTLSDGQLKSGVFHPIIERNTTVPTSREDRFYTVRDQQSLLNISVFQGESRYTADNIALGNIEIPVTPAPAGEKAADVRFSYDTNGLLEVETKIVGEDTHKRLVITDNSHSLTEKDIAKSLEKLKTIKIHPRDETQNTALLYRGNRLYAQHQGQKREAIGQLIDEFHHVLDQQDKRKIESLRKTLTRKFDDYEL